MARNSIIVKVGFIQTTKIVFCIQIIFIEGYYEDDKPRKRALNEIEGDYYDYIEMEDGEDEEESRDYVNIPA